MHILIIHDRDNVAAQIEAVIRATILNAMVDRASDALGARDLLSDKLYDLAIIDLTLPYNEYDPNPSLQAAEQLLRDMFASPRLMAPGDILGISKDDNVLGLVRLRIGEHLMGSLTEDHEGTWKQALEDRLRYIERARRARQTVTRASHDIDVLIFTALDKELAAYKDLFELRDSPDLKHAKSFNFTDREGRFRRGLAYSVDQSGPTPTASAVQSLLEQFRPRLVIMTGFCGGIESRTQIGDLLAIRSSFAWDYGKWVDKEGDEGMSKPSFKPRPTPLNVQEDGVTGTVRFMLDQNYAPSAECISKVGEKSGGEITSWRIKQVAAGSGSAVVTSLDILEQITDLDENIWAVEMESYALYHACRHTKVVKPNFICIKSVADFCNGEKDSKYHDACSFISASFARDLITQFQDFG